MPLAIRRASSEAMAESDFTPLVDIRETEGAYEIDVDDPNLFGPGEAWDRPNEIALGDHGPWVEKLQERLYEAGVNVYAANGVAGSEGRYGYVIYVRPEQMAQAADALGV